MKFERKWESMFQLMLYKVKGRALTALLAAWIPADTDSTPPSQEELWDSGPTWEMDEFGPHFH